MTKVIQNIFFASAAALFCTSVLTAATAEKTPAQKQAIAKKRQFTSSWQIAFGGTSKDIAYGVAPAENGSVIVVGQCRSYGKGRDDVLAMKVNRDGKTLWKKTFGRKRKDIAYAITRTSDGNFVAVGESRSFSKLGDPDVYVIKFDTNGNLIWENTYGGEMRDFAKAVVATGDGGVLVAGSSESFGDDYLDAYILKISKNGKEEWARVLGGERDDIANGIALTTDGGFVIAGVTQSYGYQSKDYYIIRFDKHAKQRWTKVYGEDSEDIGKGVVATADGGCVVTGSTKSFGSKRNDVMVIKVAANGKLVWQRLFGYKEKEWMNAIVKTEDGGFMMAGQTDSFGHGKFDFYVMQLNAEGHSVWSPVYGGEDKDIAYGLTRTTDGDYVVVGSTKSYGKGKEDYFIVKLKKK
ncbi:MAG: hypothetical protein DSZ05_05070 [Sulfurospirillum sp.]|nr:MAG: hypothetical protein DSZ05_05070 [Sulfurospirillum sp.]